MVSFSSPGPGSPPRTNTAPTGRRSGSGAEAGPPEVVSTGAVVIVDAAMEASSASPVPTGPVPTGPGVAVSSARNGAARATPQASAPTRQTGSPREVLARPIELPPERRLSAATLAAIAAAAGVSAIALGGWAFFSGVRADGNAANADTAPPGYQQAISLLAKPDVDRLPLRGLVRRVILVVEPSGDATLALNGLT